jgi:hypothetical protein
LDNGWIEVTTDEMKAKTKITEGVISAEIRGYKGELYGYLIYLGFGGYRDHRPVPGRDSRLYHRHRTLQLVHKQHEN